MHLVGNISVRMEFYSASVPDRSDASRPGLHQIRTKKAEPRIEVMFKILVTVAVICACLEAQVTDASTGASAEPFAIG